MPLGFVRGHKPGRGHVEIEPGPAAPLALFRENALALDFDHGGAGVTVTMNEELDLIGSGFMQIAILRARSARPLLFRH